MISKIVRALLAFLPILAILLVIGEFIVTNELAGLGQTVRQTDNQIDSLRQENESLRQQVASASSLLTIAAKASQLGLVRLPAYIVIGQEEVALRQPR